ncbi:MAG: hypothetical protein ACREDF_05790, partial [Thermoplasmata archaeon]
TLRDFSRARGYIENARGIYAKDGWVSSCEFGHPWHGGPVGGGTDVRGALLAAECGGALRCP